MLYCKDCPKKLTCDKPCDKIEKLLLHEGIYGSDYIRPQMPRSIRKREKAKYGKIIGGKWREIPFSSLSGLNEDTDPLFKDPKSPK